MKHAGWFHGSLFLHLIALKPQEPKTTPPHPSPNLRKSPKSAAPARAQDAALYKSWIDALYLRGMHIVAAGSNSGFQSAEWPAHFPTVIAVGSDPDNRPELCRASGGLTEFSSRGEEPEALWPGGGTRNLIGSSFAAPRAAAYLARLLGGHPGLHPLLAKAALRHIALPIPME